MSSLKWLLSTSGRFGRLEYWAASFLAIAIFVVCGLLLDSIDPDWVEISASEAVTAGEFWIAVLGFLLGTWIGLAASVKRLHDRAKSGFWLLLGLVPIVGELWLFIELGFLPGTDLFNVYDEALADR